MDFGLGVSGGFLVKSLSWLELFLFLLSESFSTMSKELNSNDTSSQTEHSNSKLIYEYTEYLLGYFDQGLDSIKQKTTTLLGFTPIVLKFASELPDNDAWLIITKIGTCILLTINIIICIMILNPAKQGDVVKPSELMDDWFYKEDDRIRLFISRQWIGSRLVNN